jgi:CBS domain-containing protein
MKEQKKSQAAVDVPLATVMTPDPKRVTTQDSVQEAAWIMRDLDCGSVPVVDEADRVVGILTDRDIVLRVVCEGFRGEDVKAEDVMSSNVSTAKREEPVERALRIMKQQQVRRVPIVDSDGRLVGIVAVADLAQQMEVPRELGETVERISEDHEA